MTGPRERGSVTAGWVLAAVLCGLVLLWGWTQTPVDATSSDADVVAGFGILFAGALPPGLLVAFVAARFGSRSRGGRRMARLVRSLFGLGLGGLVYVTWFWAGGMWCEACPSGTATASRSLGSAAAGLVLASCAWAEARLSRSGHQTRRGVRRRTESPPPAT